ncbi:hypothetical protein EDD17DRAFT_1621738 [Pisolithus thermaeus]|nr:hypothetical protein EDD17DRAFT_1621738 [Pisolithus thermaeus]
MASAMLYGITTLQGRFIQNTYVYYMHYSEDTSVIKLTVAAIWLFDTLHVSFMCYTLYYYLITNYGNLLSLEYVVWSFPLFVVTMLNVASFFAYKIYHLCRLKVRWMRWAVTAPIVGALTCNGKGVIR